MAHHIRICVICSLMTYKWVHMATKLFCSRFLRILWQWKTLMFLTNEVLITGIVLYYGQMGWMKMMPMYHIQFVKRKSKWPYIRQLSLHYSCTQKADLVVPAWQHYTPEQFFLVFHPECKMSQPLVQLHWLCSPVSPQEMDVSELHCKSRDPWWSFAKIKPNKITDIGLKSQQT